MSKTLESRLSEAAAHYLGRFESNEQKLRMVLRRRVERWGESDAETAIEAVIAKFKRLGAVDDARYAAAKASSMARAGKSRRAISAYLSARGIDKEIIGEQDTDDLAAAQRLAQKKRLGPFRTPETRSQNRDRDLAALGRAGFSWEIARRVIDSDD